MQGYETKINDQSVKLSNRKTAFIIAHRLLTFVLANKTLVLDKGKIVQTGMSEQLTQQSGLYQRMFVEQVLLQGDSPVCASRPESPGAKQRPDLQFFRR